MTESSGARLAVSIDHAATMRQAGLSGQPDLATVAEAAVRAGADAIAVRLYGDRRGVQDHDVAALIENLEAPLSVTMSPSEELIGFALSGGSAACCLVPERRGEFTTGGALDVVLLQDEVRPMCERLLDVEVSPMAFVDPDPAQVTACAQVGMRGVCLNCGAYSLAFAPDAIERRQKSIEEAASHAATLGLTVCARSGLDYDNVAAIAAIEQVAEVEVGHAIMAAAIVEGIASSVVRMKQLIGKQELG